MSRSAAHHSDWLVTAMAIGALIYVAVAVTAVSVVPWRELAQAAGPLTEVMARAAPAIAPWVFTAITLFAVANTALVNYVTSSRLMYGMAGTLAARTWQCAPTHAYPTPCSPYAFGDPATAWFVW